MKNKNERLEKILHQVAEEKYLVESAMIAFGGNFTKLLGYTLESADLLNAGRIKEAFPEYWEKYLKLANKAVENG